MTPSEFVTLLLKVGLAGLGLSLLGLLASAFHSGVAKRIARCAQCCALATVLVMCLVLVASANGNRLALGDLLLSLENLLRGRMG